MSALAGIRVLDLTHILSGPFATMMLADLGAEVIKIERPGAGEATRALLADDPEHSLHGMGAYFLALNRNKKSVTLDLSVAEGRQLFEELVAVADVVVYNFSLGVADRLGISRKALAERHPHIITCSVTGFGETGPHRQRVSFDMVAQAMGGGMSLTGDPGSRPLRAGLPVGDLGGGMAAVIGILAALQARHQTQLGQHVDISLQDVQVSLLSYMATMYSLSGRMPPSMGNAHAVHVPYNSYRAADGWMIVAVVGDELWRRLMDALDCPDLDIEAHRTQAGRAHHRADIDRRLSELLASAPRAHWLERLERARVPAAPVQDIAGVVADPHLATRDMMLSLEHPAGGRYRVPGTPVKLSDVEASPPSAPPILGQHTDQVLAELLGKSAAVIADLRARSIV